VCVLIKLALLRLQIPAARSSDQGPRAFKLGKKGAIFEGSAEATARSNLASDEIVAQKFAAVSN